jgi:hypothetical protein
MSASLIHYQNTLECERVQATCLISGLYLASYDQDRLPGGEVELQIVREQLELIKKFRDLHQQRIKLVEDRIDEIESQQQDAAAGH